MSFKVFLTRPLPSAAMQALQSQVDLEYNTADRVLRKEEIIAGIAGKEGLLCLLTDPIDAEIMDAAPDLKIIANYAVGYNNIDLAAAQARNILVSNTPGVLTESTAELTISLLLATARRLPEADRFTRKGQWKGWGPQLFLGKEVHGSTLGIIGMGRIGKAVARRASALGLSICYWNRTRLTEAEEQRLALRYVSQTELLRQSDFVTLHLAYTPETHHLIDATALATMRQGSFLINTARGSIVDEAALVEALQTGHLGGAGLDVFEEEPTIHPRLFSLPKVVLLPHIGSATVKTRTAMGLLAVDNLLAGLRGEKPPNLVS